MQLKVHEVGAGLHPSEVIIAVETVEGTRRLIVSRRSIEQEYIDVGLIRSRGQDELLIELPRETQNGEWRVWVRKGQVRNLEKVSA
ncbi:hypothetical protein MWN33_06435 [Starkeya koreensis]|uniref:Uncharacterized protein n=1 Tax=Ancylobacter koreensis TaxID=266121 RepID=A0ABT0DKE8_9HYPH|nr:hypothetical protein [Ancylobacter koreensis]MCK0207669.1 hypothetical protein [Ancylobacter koreensis]